jgi:hypothetical protein
MTGVGVGVIGVGTEELDERKDVESGGRSHALARCQSASACASVRSSPSSIIHDARGRSVDKVGSLLLDSITRLSRGS